MVHLRGKFIVFDGNEGCGKSTQAKLLLAAMEKAGVDAIAVRDPGATHIGEMIREILLDPANTDMAMRCEMLLYMASRAQMMREIILPSLDAGKCVICDRFVSSTLAYQLGGDGLTAEEIRAVAEVAIRGRWPDLTILLDMPVEKSSARLKRERDRIEQRPIEYHQRVRENYLSQAKHDPKRIRVIVADRAVDVVHADVMKVLESVAR
ncbi:MAG TPA: dTMP kinase [Tepidisphaeraceae bacterium]|jgi:dTMP kinase